MLESMVKVCDCDYSYRLQDGRIILSSVSDLVPVTMTRPRKQKPQLDSDDDSTDGESEESESGSNTESDDSDDESDTSSDGDGASKTDQHGPPSNRAQLAEFYAAMDRPDKREVTCIIDPETIKFYFKKM